MDLVAQIKELQRTDLQAKQQWIFYCTASAGGIRDPSKHSAESIQNFIEQYQAGTLTQEAFGENELSQCIKTAQQKSKSFSNAWKAYCSLHGGGVNDPLKHEPNYMVDFLTFVGDQAQTSLAMNMMSGGGWGAPPPAKRFKGAGSSGFGGAAGGLGGMQALMMAAMGGQGAGSGDPVKDGLVNQIKTFQRSGDQFKQLWWAYCDEQLGGVRDPAKHSAPVLRAFITAHGIEGDGSSGYGGAAGGFGGAAGGLGGLQALMNAAMGGKGAGSGDPIKDGLVNKIKAFQRSGDQFKQLWWAHCDEQLGGVRDPAKHSAPVLRAFITSHGID